MFDPSKISLDLKDNNEEKSKIGASKKKKSMQENSGNKDIIENIQIKEPQKSKAIGKEPHIDVLENKKTKIEQENGEKKNDKIPHNTKHNNSIGKIQTPAKTIFNINIKCLEDILILLNEKSYDFVILEPENDRVKISFRKDKIEKEGMYIPYPVYSKILLKIKTTTHLKVDETEEDQEGVGEIALQNKAFKIISKTVASELGEKIFLKIKMIDTQIKKEVKKVSMKHMLVTLGTFLLFALFIAGIVITFIVLSAKSVSDVAFFEQLGISLNDINDFIKQITSVIFSILLLGEISILFAFIFKFSLTKKEFKQKKVRYGILASFFLILTLITLYSFMIIDTKVKNLPKWLEMSFGTIQLYDNAKLISETFNRKGSLLTDTSNLIGPIDIKFDLTYLAEEEEKTGRMIKKYIWNFGERENEETSVPTLIKSFEKKGNYDISLIIESMDKKGEIRQKKIENINNINISHIVEIEEKILNSGGKRVTIDATNLKKLGKIEWYSLDNLDTPKKQGYTYITSKLFEETLIGMYIKRNDKKEHILDRIFIINEINKTGLDGEIEYKRSKTNDLKFELKVTNIQNDIGVGIVEKFQWIIDEKEITKEVESEDPVEGSTIHYTFQKYGPHEVRVIMTNSNNEEKELKTTIFIPQNLRFQNTLQIFNEEKLIKDIEYIPQNNEYYINDIAIPTTITFNANRLRVDNIKYSLKSISWDFGGDGSIDSKQRKVSHHIHTIGSHIIQVVYTFVHKENPEDRVIINEKIFIDAIHKEAIINLEISTANKYAPVVAKLDASKSKIDGQNIVKFIWDYGDGIIEERDSVIPGHIYKMPGEYDISVTIVGENGQKYTKTKKLILIPKPQNIKIEASMKTSFVGQGIDFGSTKSEGQIIGYLWDFGDNSISTEANPTHIYKEAGEYIVKLRLDFSNNNILEEKIKIKILETEP